MRRFQVRILVGPHSTQSTNFKSQRQINYQVRVRICLFASILGIYTHFIYFGQVIVLITNKYPKKENLRLLSYLYFLIKDEKPREGFRVLNFIEVERLQAYNISLINIHILCIYRRQITYHLFNSLIKSSTCSTNLPIILTMIIFVLLFPAIQF